MLKKETKKSSTKINCDEDNEQDKTETNDCTEKDPNLVSPMWKYVDNKRKLLEKQLSASQCDQVYLNVARDELKIKHKMVDSLTEIKLVSHMLV